HAPLHDEPKSDRTSDRTYEREQLTDEPKSERAYGRREPTTDELAAAAGLPRPGEYTVLRRVGYALRPIVVVTSAAMAAFMSMNQVAKLIGHETNTPAQAPSTSSPAAAPTGNPAQLLGPP